MQKKNPFLYLLLILLPFSGIAANKTIVCDSPQGTRIDYFSVNNINLKNETFLMGRDRVSGMQPTIILDDNNKDVSFVIGDAAELKSASTKTGNMTVLAYNDDQISFTGLVNNAPILATYYPKINVLIYSQQSIWPGPNYEGARAVLFYAKCKTSQ